MEKTKDWLNRGRGVLAEIAALEEARRAAENRATKITVTLRERVNTGKAGKRNDSTLVTTTSYSMEIDKRTTELHTILSEISTAIYAVQEGTFRVILINRYILFKKWKQIAVDMSYNCDHLTKHLHPMALEAVSKYIEL